MLSATLFEAKKNNVNSGFSGLMQSVEASVTLPRCSATPVPEMFPWSTHGGAPIVSIVSLIKMVALKSSVDWASTARGANGISKNNANTSCVSGSLGLFIGDPFFFSLGFYSERNQFGEG